jgi:hypothetical protein
VILGHPLIFTRAPTALTRAPTAPASSQAIPRNPAVRFDRGTRSRAAAALVALDASGRHANARKPYRTCGTALAQLFDAPQDKHWLARDGSLAWVRTASALGERRSLLHERLGNLIADLPDYRGNQVTDRD